MNTKKKLIKILPLGVFLYNTPLKDLFFKIQTCFYTICLKSSRYATVHINTTSVMKLYMCVTITVTSKVTNIRHN